MKLPQQLIMLFLCINCFALSATSQTVKSGHQLHTNDTIVIPFEYKQSALYQGYTMQVIDSVISILKKNDSVTLSIDGYAHQDEGNDTITKYLSLDRALFVESYVLGRGIDSSRIISVVAYGRTRQLYRGTRNMGLGNCRAVIKMNYPPPSKADMDTDGDEITDDIDECPEIYGEIINNGCPDTNAIIVPFENQQTALNAQTYKVLDSVIAVLRHSPAYTIAIKGHAYKTEGTPSVCDHLAKERADIVKGYLLTRYIGAARIDSITSLGTTRPITAGRNSQEILRNVRAEIYLNKH